MESKKDFQEYTITILVPCYNEELGIVEFYNELKTTLSPYSYNIIFIDDGSLDNTLNLLKLICETDKQATYISLSRNFGHQTALKAGYDHAHVSDCVISIDADLQQPPVIIHQMIDKWLMGFHIVNGVRKRNDKLGVLKRGSSWLFYKTINLLSKYKVIHSSPDFRLMDKKVVKIIRNLKEQNLFFREIISWIGFRQTTVEFNVEKRNYGKSKYSIKKMFSLSLNAFFAYGINPLRLAILVGFLLSFSSFAYAFYAIYNYLFNYNVVPGWTSLMASFLFIAGFQFILIGVIGEYLGKTFLETRNRPLYVIGESNLGHNDLNNIIN